jgi:glycosyltransferase involved in cell wall biosynthesis
LVQTARALEVLGVPIRPLDPWVDRIENARILHLFGMSREGLELAKVAHARRTPVVLSPICWFEPRALFALAGSRLGGCMHLTKWAVRRCVPRWPGWRRQLLNLADRILPNSHAEADQLVTLLGARRDRIHVVPNGVDPSFGCARPHRFRADWGPGDFILYAGRIEPRKNVQSIVRACRLAGLPLVVIGAVVPGFERYGAACVAEGESNTTWIGPRDHADPLLASAMAAARVFALPSWFETPGLAALEAAAAGCAVVITPYGCTREYFGHRAVYANPSDTRQIAQALQRAWETGPHAGLADHVLDHFAWSTVAQATKEAYDRVSA